tara:strand:- start:1307 stop:4066 length:2760 start_codon:yes stop_codon:yes gene_type:complete
MSANRELSQFGAFVDVDDTLDTIGISTDIRVFGKLTADELVGLQNPPGKTIFVAKGGSDTNTGLTEADAKLTVKSAVSMAMPGDTVIVYPGQYIEDNPIFVKKTVTIRGRELRNCIITPKNLNRDIFHVSNGVHITDFSFIGPAMTDGAAIVAFHPLVGVSSNREFDAARLIRDNLDFIAAEAVGYLTSTDYRSPAFLVQDAQGNPTDPQNCRDDVRDVFKAVCHDLTRGGNSKSIGAGVSYFSNEGALQHIVGVKTETIDTLNYAIGIAHSCINNVIWEGDYQDVHFQVRDLSIQADPLTGSNIDANSCASIKSAITNYVGIVTTIIHDGLNSLGPSGIQTSYPGNAGYGITNFKYVTNASYDAGTGDLTLTIPNFSVKRGDLIEVRDMDFECTSGGITSTAKFPSGRYGNEFLVDFINSDGSFKINVGTSTITHNYIGGGFAVDRWYDIENVTYDGPSGTTTITASSDLRLSSGDFVKLRDIEFQCSSGAATTTIYPSGKNGTDFRVNSVTGAGTTQTIFTVNVGPSTIPHTYVQGGLIGSPYSPGVGPILQGPYTRNCTNFIPDSIGMKVDGLAAEPGDQEDVGVTGSMSVDSYTQYNQGGIGVSITNGAYAQLVSIFTICNQTAIFTASGGQCDITNSNSSFGTFGLVSDGVGDATSKSVYRFTGISSVATTTEDDVIVIGDIGLRPYTGQSMFIDELYYEVQSVRVTNGGSGYTTPPTVVFTEPTGPQAIRAEGFATLDENGSVAEVSLIGSGRNYRSTDNVTVTLIGGGGTLATAEVVLAPLYYKVIAATDPTAGISSVTISGTFNNDISIGSTCYFSRQSLQIVSSHSFEFIGSGNDILQAKPALGGVTITENEIIKQNGGQIVYTSTDQDGNFAIGDDVQINQSTGTIEGRAFEQSLLNTVTPLIIALGGI